MNLPWHEWTGLVGVATVLLAFLLLQAHRLHGNGLIYQAMNALGALGIVLSLAFGAFNLSALLMELGWIAISVYGMLVNRRRAGRAKAPPP
ncbi:MAG TPA: hypothetical protein VFN09_15750 [Rhodanobacteraceae bacterium]|nr:hypothetical protein [Rhodanobacteraceae bacterium]